MPTHPPVTIRLSGCGLCSSGGSRLGELAERLGTVTPDAVPLPADLKKQLRRRSAFITAGVMAAREALQSTSEAAAPDADPTATGIIVTSRIGDQNTTSEFIDDLLDFGLDQGSPIKFAHSSHNAAASYIATLSGIYGPAVTAINFADPFANGLILAECWLRQRVCRRIVLLQIESCSRLSQILAGHAAEGDAFVFTPEREGTVYADSREPCEAACLLLSARPEDDAGPVLVRTDVTSIDRTADAAEPLPGHPLPEPVRLIAALLSRSPDAEAAIGGAVYRLHRNRQP